MLRAVSSLLLAALGTAAGAVESPRLPDPLCVTPTFVRRTQVISATDLTATVEPPAWAQVVAKRCADNRWEVVLTVAKTSRGQALLTLRGADGAAVATTHLQVVTLTSTATSGINGELTLADKSMVFAGELVLQPHVPGLEVRFVNLSKDNTGPDGRPEWWAASETFTPIPVTGGSWTPFRIVRAPNAKWTPYSAALYQGTEQVGVF